MRGNLNDVSPHPPTKVCLILDIMKYLVTAILLCAGCSGRAGLVVSQLFDVGGSAGIITVGSPFGATFPGNFTQAPAGLPLVGGVSVILNVTGGYNGDFYSYLKAPNGTMVQLLDQPGTDAFGSPASGFTDLTLSAGAATSIQAVDGTPGQPLTGTYQADGNLNDFGTGTAPGGSANGQWSIYFADLGSGGGSPTLESWALEITAVPEPLNAAFLIFGSAFLALTGAHWLWSTRINSKQKKSRSFRSGS